MAGSVTGGARRPLASFLPVRPFAASSDGNGCTQNKLNWRSAKAPFPRGSSLIGSTCAVRQWRYANAVRRPELADLGEAVGGRLWARVSDRAEPARAAAWRGTGRTKQLSAINRQERAGPDKRGEVYHELSSTKEETRSRRHPISSSFS